MAKKKAFKGKKENPSKGNTKADPTAESKQEKPFDFGGLPERDIKKNLGCG